MMRIRSQSYREGLQARFMPLLEEHKRLLYKVANAYAANPDDRQDLAQEIVIQLWSSFPRFDGRCRFSTWSYRVAINTAISFCRSGLRNRRNMPGIEGIEIAFQEPAIGAAGDDLRLLYELIGSLGEVDRALILLSLDGFAHAEIADIVGLTPTNVATRISRIKQKLQGKYEETLRERSGENSNEL